MYSFQSNLLRMCTSQAGQGRVIVAQQQIFRTAEQGADHTINLGILNDLAMDNALLHAVCPIRALPTPSPVRETREGVAVRPEQPSGALFACFFTGGPLDPETPLSKPPSSAYGG